MKLYLVESLAQSIRALDSCGAPDSDYRKLLSSLARDPLRSRETWRQRALFALGARYLATLDQPN